jgi:hypothetical protein
MYTINPEKTALTLQERIAEIAALEKMSQTAMRHDSDGSELIPAEVQAKIRLNGSQLLDAPLMDGYTVDGEGFVNAYSIEPAMYLAGYPSPEAQRRYVVQGAIAALLVTLTVLIAFSVS